MDDSGLPWTRVQPDLYRTLVHGKPLSSRRACGPRAALHRVFLSVVSVVSVVPVVPVVFVVAVVP